MASNNEGKEISAMYDRLEQNRDSLTEIFEKETRFDIKFKRVFEDTLELVDDDIKETFLFTNKILGRYIIYEV